MSDGWISTTGSEFGEVDNPAYGGYTEPNWNKGAWGDTLSGWGNKGVALPNVPHGTMVEVRNPTTGQTAIGPVKDIGPAADTGAGIDLLGGLREAVGLPRNFKGPIEYRIVGQSDTAPSLAAGQPSLTTQQSFTPSPTEAGNREFGQTSSLGETKTLATASAMLNAPEPEVPDQGEPPQPPQDEEQKQSPLEAFQQKYPKFSDEPSNIVIPQLHASMAPEMDLTDFGNLARMKDGFQRIAEAKEQIRGVQVEKHFDTLKEFFDTPTNGSI